MIVLSLVLNSFTNDSRVVRATRTYRELGGKAYVFGLHEPGFLEEEYVNGITVKRFRLVTRPWPKKYYIQFIKYFEVLFRMVVQGRRLKPDIIHANDLNTLPIGYFISRLAKCKLIYDSHELETDRSEKRFPFWFSRITAKMEKILAKKADVVITVSKSIAEVMAENLGINEPIVIRNVPERYRYSSKPAIGPLRRSLNLNKEVPIVLYQGCIDPGRGIEVLVKAFTVIKNTEAVLVFLGDGQLKESLMSFVTVNKLDDRVYFHPSVPAGKLLNWTADATIGIHPMEDICLNHRYALPNKLFQYIQAGLPVIVTDLPEMKRVVEEYRIGEVFPSGDYNKLAEKIDKLLSDINLLKEYHLAALNAAKELNWEKEKKRLENIFRTLIAEIR